MENYTWNKYKGWIILGVTLFVIVSVVAFVYGYFNDIRYQNRRFEIDASTQFQVCQDELSTTVTAYADKFGIYNFALSGMQSIIEGAISGRYDHKNAAGQSNGSINTNLLIQAVSEAYPNTEGVTDFAREFSTWIGARRESFSQCQQKLLSIFNAWDAWRSQDMLRDQFSSGYPDDKLVAKVGETTFYGRQAWDKMHQLVLAGEAVDAYNKGVMPTMAVPTRMP